MRKNDICIYKSSDKKLARERANDCVLHHSLSSGVVEVRDVVTEGNCVKNNKLSLKASCERVIW